MATDGSRWPAGMHNKSFTFKMGKTAGKTNDTDMDIDPGAAARIVPGFAAMVQSGSFPKIDSAVPFIWGQCEGNTGDRWRVYLLYGL